MEFFLPAASYGPTESSHCFPYEPHAPSPVSQEASHLHKEASVPPKDHISDFIAFEIYWKKKGNPASLEVHDHCILFENDTVIVDGKSHGNVYDRDNEAFLESLEKLTIPDEFKEDGTHVIRITKIGDTGPAKFDKEYFSEISEMMMYQMDSDKEVDPYEFMNSSDEEIVWSDQKVES